MKLRFIYLNSYQRPINVNAHVHNVYELVYYISGQGVSHYGQGSAQICDGSNIVYTNNMTDPDVFYFENNSFILYPPGTVHDERHSSPAQLIAIGFEDDGFPIDPVAKMFKDYDLSVLRTMEKIAEEYRERNFLYHKVIEAVLTELLVSIYRSRGIQPRLGQFDSMEYALMYINEYFTTDVNIESLAESSNYSVSRFRELFKARTGVSPKTYILEKRIDYAKQLLRETKLSLREISQLTGFTDYPQFNKFFNRRLGMNPKEYRFNCVTKQNSDSAE